MRATILMAGTSLLLLTGCGSVQTLTTVPADCAVTDSITVEHGPGRLGITQECIRVTEGASVTVSFSPSPAAGARTKFRGFGNRWLDRRNTESGDPARIIVAVPRGAAGRGADERRSYKYEIHVEGVGILDPRIVVQR